MLGINYTELLKKAARRVASEPAVTLGVVVGAINTATDHTWKGYAVAVAIALGRFAVSPVVKPKK